MVAARETRWLMARVVVAVYGALLSSRGAAEPLLQ